MKANNNAMREALVGLAQAVQDFMATKGRNFYPDMAVALEASAAALAAPPYTGKWMNGRKYEYEYAYCSECGRMQWAGWDTHKQAEESIGSFADDYRFCPGCGAKMEGGVYVK